MADGPDLLGCRVAVTRERPGRLAELLDERGAEIVHVPLIEVVDADDGGAALRQALADPVPADWILVTSAAGAEAVAHALGSAGRLATLAAAETRVGCVGTATAARWKELAGRPADLVPARQLASELATAVDEVSDGTQRVVVAQADRAGDDLVEGLRRRGHQVTVVTAYRTRTRRPDQRDLDELSTVDAVLFASGSAIDGWTQALGADALDRLPDLVVVIGPTTAAAAERNGLKNVSVAADHSLPGLVQELAASWARARE